MKFKQILIALTLLYFTTPILIEGVLNGDIVQWNRHGYLVKILARRTEDGAVQNCLGSIVSASLILTSPDCVKNTTTLAKLDDFVVVISHLKKVNGKHEKYYSAALIDISDSWALLKIKPLDIAELCPPNPAPKRVTQIPIMPSLSNPSMIELNPYLYRRSNCYMVGFETTENASDFVHSDKEEMKTLRIPLEALIESIYDMEPTKLYQSRIVQNITACFDDMGAAIICHILPQNRDFQVGMFRFLNFYQSTKVDRSSIETCLKATEMKFSMLSGDEQLFNAIQRSNFAEFIQVYKACEFIENEEN